MRSLRLNVASLERDMSRKWYLLPLLLCFVWLMPTSADAASQALSITYTARYYDNQWFNGSPVMTRQETGIRHAWGNNSPGAGIEADHFSVSWEGNFSLNAATKVRMYALADDGIRISINGQTMLYAWDGEAKPGYIVERVIPAGNHTILVEYFEHSGNAHATVQLTALETVAPANPVAPAAPAGCTIPATGPWPPCATGGGGSAPAPSGDCVIPASGPWPPCATNGSGGGESKPASGCVIPQSGPWPACAK